MLISAVALGLVGSVLFAIVLIIQVLRGKNAVPALAGFGLCVVMLLCGGYLFSITDGVIPPVEDKPASAQKPLPKVVEQKPQEPVDAARAGNADVNTLSQNNDNQTITTDTSTPSSDAQIKKPETLSPPEDGVYRIGDTWTVEGQWSVTVTGVTETSDRNEYSAKNPEAVYILDFTYTNLGYEEEYSDGIFISLGDLGTIVDSSGMMAYSYPGDISKYSVETPVGATCEAQDCIGVDNAGDFKIIYSIYDNSGNRQSATFEINID